jgi:RimJ/RimL family protein N-acetyltransferase
MIYLQPFERSDFDLVMQWASDARLLMQWAGPIFEFPLDYRQLDAYLAATVGEKPRRVAWKAVDGTRQGVVGHIEIDHIDYGRRCGALSRVLIGAPELRGRGLGRELVREAVRRGFVELDLTEINLSVFDFNSPAIRCYEANGFELFHAREGAVTIGDERWGALFMRLTRATWERKRRDRGAIIGP